MLRRKPNKRQRAWWKAIHRARLQGLSKRAIAKNLGISRNTVKKYLAAESPEMVGAVVTPRIRPLLNLDMKDGCSTLTDPGLLPLYPFGATSGVRGVFY